MDRATFDEKSRGAVAVVASPVLGSENAGEVPRCYRTTWSGRVVERFAEAASFGILNGPRRTC